MEQNPYAKYLPDGQADSGDSNPYAKYASPAAEPAKPKSRSLIDVANDTVIETANAAAGGVSAAANFVKPGNALSGFIDKNIIKAGQANQSDPVKAEKQRYADEMTAADGMGDEASATLGYVARNPLLAAAQAVGSFAGPGLAVKGAGTAAKAAGLGAKATERAGRAGGVVAGGAMAGGDAAGTAYELAKQGGANDEQAEAAGRQASVLPGLIGAAGGAFGAERLLAGGKGFAGNALSRAAKTGLSEAGQEAVEEGVTQYEGQRAAMPFNPDIDPMKGVAGAATMGAALGGVTGTGVSLLTPSQRMGLNANDGPLSKAAAQLVDQAPDATPLQQPAELALEPLAHAAGQELSLAPQDAGPAARAPRLSIAERIAAMPPEARTQAEILTRELQRGDLPTGVSRFRAAELQSLLDGNPAPDPDAMDMAPEDRQALRPILRTFDARSGAAPESPLGLAPGSNSYDGGIDFTPDALAQPEQGVWRAAIDRLALAENLTPGDALPLERAQALRDQAQAEGIPATVSPHASGQGFDVQPTARLAPDQRGAMPQQTGAARLGYDTAPGDRVMVDRDGGARQERRNERGTEARQERIAVLNERERRESLGLDNHTRISPIPGEAAAGDLAVQQARVDATNKQQPVDPEFIASTGRDMQVRRSGPALGRDYIDAQSRVVNDQAIGMTRRLTWTQGDAGRNADVAGRPIDGEWTAFAQESGTLGVPRAEMPQIQSEHRGALVNYLKGKGVNTQAGEVQAQSLKPTQAEFSQGKVQWAGQFSGNDRAILISADGYVVDGHHQWLAKRAAGGPVKVLQLQAPIQDLLPLVSQFPSARVASGAAALTQETETYASQANQAQPSSAEPQASAGPTAAPGVTPSGQATAGPVAAGAARKARSGGDAARSRAWDANPMRAFLGKHGVTLGSRSEFAPGLREQRGALVPGYGPVFRRTGKPLDRLVDNAVEEGFLPRGATDADLYGLIDRALRQGERVAPLYTADAAEGQMQAMAERQQQLEQEQQEAWDQEASEYEAVLAQELASMDDAEYEALDADIPALNAGSNTSTEAAMRTLGFTEQEIQYVVAQQSREPQEGGRIYGQDGGTVSGRAQAGAGAGQSAARRQEQELSSYTREEVLERQAAQERAQAQQAQVNREADLRSQADRELPEFTLTGSVRAADANPEQRGIFDQPAERAKPNASAAATPKENRKSFADKPGDDSRTSTLKGSLVAREQQKTEAFERLKMVRQAVKDGRANRLDLLKAEDAHRTLVREVASLKAEIPQFSRANGPAQSLPQLREQFAVQGIAVDIGERNEVITLYRIVVPEGARNAGSGTSAMRELVEYADRTGQHIALTPSEDFGGNKKRLVDFYKRFGFIENKGRNRAFQTSEAMYRQAPGKVLYSRTERPAVTNAQAQQLRRAMTQRTVDGLANGWSQRPDIVVVNSMQDAAVPEVVRRADELQRSQGAAGNVEGFWHSGKVYLVADALPSSQDVTRVLYHEVLGHHGLRGHFGPGLDMVRDQVAKMRPKDIQAKAKEYGLDLTNPAHVRYASEEVLAEMAQTRPDLALVQRAIAAIRTFLREHVPGFKSLELTDAEIVRNYLLPARGYIERGGLMDGVQQESALSRSAMKSVDANIARGQASLAKALTDRTSVHRAMFRNGLGWVDFVWGTEGAIKPSGKTKGAMGLSHILEARQRKDGLTEAQAVKSLSEMVGTIASGREIDRGTYGNTVSVKVEHDGFRVGMVKTAGSNAWVVTAFEVNQVQGRPDVDARLSTQSKSTLPRSGLGAGSVAPDDTVPSLGRATHRDSTERGSPAGADDGRSLTPGNDAGNAQFSRSQPKAAINSSMGTLTAEQERAYLAVAGFDKVPTLRERTKAFTANIGLRIKQAMVDQFAPIAELDQGAYMLARMSKGSDGTLEAALLYGKPVLRDGVPDVDVKDGGFAQVLASLKGEQDRFLMWVAAQRAESLKAQGKENLFDDRDISSLKTLDAGRMVDGTNRAPLYANALQDLNAFNDSVLKMAQESGLIDQAAYDLMQGQPYVPFYRLMEEEGGMQGQSFSKGLTNQKAWKKLKGGSQQLNGDLLQNLLLNWGNLYAASARNRAALATMDAAEKMAVAYKVPADTKGAAKVMRDGMTEHWAVEDPYLLEAISALNYSASPLMKPLAKAKQVLTWGVTVNPTFKLRNLVRDAVSSISMADLSYNPAANVSKGWKLTAKDSQVYASMLASGGVIKFGTQENTERLRAQVAKLGGVVLDQNGAQKLWGQVKALYNVYNEFGDRTENVNRTALYDRLIAKGYSHAEASFMARDLMDFSMSGNHPVVRFLTQSVPFLNARLQGLYKLGRAAKADPRRFATVAGAVTLASLGLMAAYADDEDWKKREDWDRDAYWWFKIGGTAYRIPKPFEVGAIGTLAERTAELALSEEMTNKRFAERLSHMVAQTFAFDPVPQAFKPLLDIYSNKDSFTGRSIESQADQRLRPEDRYSERTSEVARLLGSWGLPDPAQLLKGEYAGLSPKQVDHLLRGYFSWAASAVTTATDYAIRPALDRGDRPAMRLKDVFLAGNFVESLPSGSSRYVSAMYEQSRDVEQAYASYRDALARGDREGAADMMVSDGDKIRSRGAVSTATKLLSQLNQQAKKIEADAGMESSEKRERLQRIEQRRHEIARRVMGAGAT